MVRLTYILRLRLSRFLIASSSNIFRESGAFYALKQKKATHKVFTETFSNTLCVAILLFYLIPKEKNLLRLIGVKT